MKIEKLEGRGKYPGCKIHGGVELCKFFMDLYKNPTPDKFLEAQKFSVKLGKKLVELELEYPNLLKERTPEEVKAELQNEFDSAKAKLDAMSTGLDWKGIKVVKPTLTKVGPKW